MVLTNEFVKAQERESEKQVLKTKKTLAFVVYPGISLLELVGNRTLLGDILKVRAGFEPVVVGACVEVIPTDTPLSIIPQVRGANSTSQGKRDTTHHRITFARRDHPFLV